jgi:N-acyl-D-aspartate/D-glutamate deacylase
MGSILVRGGRVCDPGTGFDGIGDVLVEDGRIAAVAGSIERPDAAVIDATGLVVGPGFIDVHSHTHSVTGHWLQAFDGVTTALDLETGLSPVDEAYRRAATAGRPLNYGFSASWALSRGTTLLGIPADPDIQATLDLLGREDWQRSSSPRELAALLAILEDELADGALGIGVLIGYAPHSDPGEYRAVADLAARADAPVFTHIREIAETDPTTPVDGADEVVRVAGETGVAIHHCHVTSTSRRHLDRTLAGIDAARRAGSRVTVEAYPYDAGATAIGAAFLAPERLAARGMVPSDIVVVATGERVADAARLRQLRAEDPGATCINRYLHEEDPADAALIRLPFEMPDSMPASDGMAVVGIPDAVWPLPAGGRTHPRTGGTFTKTLRLMVRETGAWTWPEAFRRSSYLPARLLDDVAPAARAKGHLGVGADADIVVLDPHTVSETATYLDSTRPARGVRHLIVSGEPVIRDGELLPDARPGRALRGAPR